MCGFSGIIEKNKLKNNSIHDMVSAIEHRGPDNQSFYDKEVVHLGFCRLQIIDLKTRSNQPMVDKETGTVIVFNGEIYNYIELREILKSEGCIFETDSDTEVILRGYLKWGKEILKRLRGMFAFAIIKDKNLFMARDHFGIKPLYYGYDDEGAFLFSSELKGILNSSNFAPKLNISNMKSYFELQHLAGENTMVKGIKRLPNGAYIEIEDFSSSLDIKLEKYFDFELREEIRDEDEAVDLIDKALRESISLHKRADVKFGTFLSGGVDSSYVTALTMPESSYSVGFAEENGKFDESNYAKELSDILGIKNRRETIDKSDVLKELRNIIYYLDEPQANLSSIPLFFLSKMAREEVTVVLSGEGADELFGGYELYKNNSSIEKYQKLPKTLRRCMAGIANIVPSPSIRQKLKKGALDIGDIFIGEANISSEKEVEEILNKKYSSGFDIRELTKPYFKRKDELSAKQLVDLNFFMQNDILLKGDRMTMAHGLEARVPFLDLGVYDVARKLSKDLKVRGDITKYALRKAAGEVLPKDWYQRPKKGFPVPFRDWLREEDFYREFREIFTSNEAAEFFDRDKLMLMLNEHKSGIKRNHRRLYSYYVFLVWYESMIKRRGKC